MARPEIGSGGGRSFRDSTNRSKNALDLDMDTTYSDQHAYLGCYTHKVRAVLPYGLPLLSTVFGELGILKGVLC